MQSLWKVELSHVVFVISLVEGHQCSLPVSVLNLTFSCLPKCNSCFVLCSLIYIYCFSLCLNTLCYDNHEVWSHSVYKDGAWASISLGYLTVNHQRQITSHFSLYMHACAVTTFLLTQLKKITTKRYLLRNSYRIAVLKYSYIIQTIANCTRRKFVSFNLIKNNAYFNHILFLYKL